MTNPNSIAVTGLFWAVVDGQRRVVLAIMQDEHSTYFLLEGKPVWREMLEVESLDAGHVLHVCRIEETEG